MPEMPVAIGLGVKNLGLGPRASGAFEASVVFAQNWSYVCVCFYQIPKKIWFVNS